MDRSNGRNWQEGYYLYRELNGVRVFDATSWADYSKAIPRQPSQSEGLLEKIQERKWRQHYRIPKTAYRATTENFV